MLFMLDVQKCPQRVHMLFRTFYRNTAYCTLYGFEMRVKISKPNYWIADWVGKLNI